MKIQSSFHLSFFCGQGGLSAQTYVHIQIEDLNDNAPLFNPDEYSMSISSYTEPGTEILNVIATDPDCDRFGQVTYNLLPGDVSILFTLDKQTGEHVHEKMCITSEWNKCQKIVAG